MIIGIEDVFANALIEVKSRENTNGISIDKAEKYCYNVIDKLKEQGINARFCADRYKFDDFKKTYSDYFTIIHTGTDTMCFIKEGITINDLNEKFRGYLSIPVLLAFIDDVVIEKSGLVSKIIEVKNKTKKQF